jgi:hypothetical protein
MHLNAGEYVVCIFLLVNFVNSNENSSNNNPNPKPIPTRKARGPNTRVRDRVTTSTYLPTSWPDYQKLVKDKYGCSGSERLSQLMLKDLAEIEGKAAPTEQNIKFLEMEISSLIRKCKTIGQYLAKQGVYSQLENLVDREFKLADDLKNLDVVIKQMLEYLPKRSDDFNRDDLELMVQLLSLNRQKAQQKRILDDMRLGKGVAPSQQPAVATVVAFPAGTRVSKPENVVVAPTSEVTPIVSTQPAVSLEKKIPVAPTLLEKEAENEVKRKIDEEAARKIANRPLPQPCYFFKKGVPEIKLLSNSELAELKKLGGDADEEED